MPPGASRAVPGSSASPRRPRAPSAARRASSRAASEAVKPGRHVLDDQAARAQRAGSAGRSSPSARGPPVEEAMTHERAGAPRGGRQRGGARARRRAVARRRGACRRRRGAARAGVRRPARDLAAELLAEGVEAARRPPGLATSSNAPSASASTARAPWAGEKAETTMTGTGGLPRRSARSTPRPSRPGMARSSVMRVGPRARGRARAPRRRRAAAPTTSKPAARARRPSSGA